MREEEAKKPLTRRERRAAKRAERKAKARAKRAAWNKTVRLFPANKKGKHIMHFMNFLRILLVPLHFLIYPYRILGHKKVGLGAYIYYGNHYTIWDIFYPARTTWEGIHFLSKQSLLEAPILGKWGQRIGAIGAMRDGSDIRTLMEAIKVLKNGEKVSLFPEGTRNKKSDEEFLPFHGGAALMAIKTKTPVIPFVLCERPRPFHLTHVVFAEPMELTEYYDRKLSAEEYAEAEEKLKNRLYEVRAEFRASHQKGKKGKKANKTADKKAETAADTADTTDTVDTTDKTDKTGEN